MARGKQHVSATSIDDANYCDMRHYLIHVERVPTETRGILVSGQVMHSLGEHFYELLGEKYETANEFCKYGDRQWFNRIIKDEARAIDLLVAMELSIIEDNEEKRADLESRLSRGGVDKKGKKYKSGREKLDEILENEAKLEKKRYKLTKGRIKKLNKELIVWRDESEKWVIRDRIKKSCFLFYDWLIKEGKPFDVEIPFYFELDGIRYKGRIDRLDIRDGAPLITDYKTGSKPVMKYVKIRKDPQMTFYGLGLSAKAYSDPEFARISGLDGEAKLLMGNPKFLSERIRYRYVEVGMDEIKPNETTRTDDDYYALKRMIEVTKKNIANGNICARWGRKCDYCFVSKACLERAEKDYADVEPGGQHSFYFMTPPYAKKAVSAVPEIKQATFRFPTKKIS